MELYYDRKYGCWAEILYVQNSDRIIFKIINYTMLSYLVLCFCKHMGIPLNLAFYIQHTDAKMTNVQNMEVLSDKNDILLECLRFQ